MSLANMKIGLRLGLGFGVILLLMISVALLGIKGMESTDAALEEILNDDVHKMQLVHDMSESVHIVARVMRTLVLLTDENTVATEYQKIENARAKYNAALEDLEKTEASESGKIIRAKIKEAQMTARTLNDKVIDLAKAHKDAEAVLLLLSEANPATAKWQDALDEYVELQKTSSKEHYEAAQVAYSNVHRLMLLLTAVAVILGLGIAWSIARSITKPINAALKLAQTVATGDLTSQIDVKSTDEIGQLMLALSNMQNNLRNLISQIQVSADSISSGAQEISSGNTDLSSRTEEQASSLEETASSMEEMASTVKQNAENAKHANVLAGNASTVAVKGGAVVSEVVTTMADINTSSKKIVDIISVIDGIAFQTNILALNAAVEAARAGEQGRGFAVVAAEVRSLAQRSASAAKEIKQLIGDSVEKVAGGTQLVGEAGKTMAEIVAAVKQVTDIVNEIAAASQEQSAGIDQVNNAITQMDEVTQQNAALVEEAAAAASSLEAKAQDLTDATNMFKLGDSQRTLGSQASSFQSSSAQSNGHRNNLNEIKTSRPNELPQAKTNTGKRLKAPKAKADEAKDWEEF